MIQRICLVLEALSIVICLHHLYGEKFRFDIETTSLLAIDMIMMQTIDYYKLPSVLSVLIYPIIALYCGKKFGFNFRAIIINNILYMVIVSGIQIGVMMSYYYISDIQLFDNKDLVIVNILALLIILFILPKCKLNKFSNYLQDRERIFIIALVGSIIITIYCLVQYKNISQYSLYQYILMFMSILIICFLASQIGKYKMKSKEIEAELRTHQLYEGSFYSLINNIRLRQHEFDNHINAINNLHYMCDTYEELVCKQGEYCEVVIKENRFNKLLKGGNPLVIGFLYGKFLEAEKFGIEISYTVNIKNLDVGIPTYKLVEVLGNLIKNAVEELKKLHKDKMLYVEIIETGEAFKVEVRNKSNYISQNELEKFFKKGYSQKGEERGLGLYNVKTICMEYSLNILCENKYIEDENWLSFVIDNKKRNQ